MPRPIAADQRGRLLRMLIRGLMCGPTRTGMGLPMEFLDFWLSRVSSGGTAYVTGNLIPAHAYLNSNPSLNIEFS